MALTLLSLVGVIVLAIQKCFQAPAWMQGANWVFVPLLVIYGTLFLLPYQAWILALVLGVLTDFLSEARLGSNAVCLLILSGLLQTQYLERWRKKIYAQIFLALVGTMFFLIVDYLSFSLQRGHFFYSDGILFKMTVASLLNAFMAPFVFSGLNWGLKRLGAQLPSDSIYEEEGV
ncbi:MAG: hypothetical protein K1X66_02775 [Verrucomicrobiae bacterium]|nr:hypothetical protein [Verrucomicrobiae bacterium]